jgi:hypothetical protein
VSFMPGLSVDGLLPACFDSSCWHDGCGESVRLPGSLLRCARCRTARYCNRACQASDWRARHKEECGQVEQLASAARSVVHPSAVLSVVAPFGDDVQGVLASDAGILGTPKWRFMRLETNVQGLAAAGCGTATRRFWQALLEHSERRHCLHDLWRAVYSPNAGRLPEAVAMSASQDAAGRVIARPLQRSLSLTVARRLQRRLCRAGLCLFVLRSVPKPLRPLWAAARVATFEEALPGVQRICITEAFLQEEATAEKLLQRLVLLNVAVLRDAAPAP